MKNWSTITQESEFSMFQTKTRTKRTNVMSNNITKNKPKGKDSSGLDYVVHILTKSLDTWLRS